MLKSMKNMYPEACSICRGTVRPGEGTLRGSRAKGWTVTHADRCVTNKTINPSLRHGYAQAFTRRMLKMINAPHVTTEEITESLTGLAELVRTGWASKESCEKAILKARAFKDFDRLEVEDLISIFLSELTPVRH